MHTNSSNFTLHTWSYLLQTIHLIMYSRHLTLHTAHCTMHTAHWKLKTEYCALRTAHWTLHTAYCTLYIAHCIMHTANCTLHTEIINVASITSSACVKFSIFSKSWYVNLAFCVIWWVDSEYICVNQEREVFLGNIWWQRYKGEFCLCKFSVSLCFFVVYRIFLW